MGDKVNADEPNKRQQSLKASFDYTINKLDNAHKDLLQRLTYFNSPFPLQGAEEIFGIEGSQVVNLYNRSLLSRIESDDVFGKIEDPGFFLYKFHPATREYIEKEMQKKLAEKNFYEAIPINYGERFADFYYHLLDDVFHAIENEDNYLTDKIIRFNIIFRENNEFERIQTLTNRLSLRAEVFTFLGSLYIIYIICTIMPKISISSLNSAMTAMS